MAKRVQSFSLSEEALAAARSLAGARGVSASRLVDDLLLRESAKRGSGSVPEVVVDGVRFVPARRGRS